MDIDARGLIDLVAGKKHVEGFKGSDGLTYCLNCGQPLEMHLKDERLGIDRNVPIMCACQKKSEAARQERYRQEAVENERRRCFRESRQGLSDRLYNATFANDRGYNPEAMKIAKGYVNTFDELKTGLLLYGTVGTGKSFIAACICNALIDKGHSARFTSFIKLAALMQESYEAKAEILREILKPDLLVIDDLGTERDTKYINEIVYAVIEQRYQFKRPMVITTNLTEDDLRNPPDLNKARVYDRILESCEPVPVIGKSVRRQGFKDRHAENIERMKGAAQ